MLVKTVDKESASETHNWAQRDPYNCLTEDLCQRQVDLASRREDVVKHEPGDLGRRERVQASITHSCRDHREGWYRKRVLRRTSPA